MKRESWEWLLVFLVATALAVPIGIALFDHPLIFFLPLSGRKRSKKLEQDPIIRRAVLAATLVLLAFAVPAYAADPCSGLAGVAAEVEDREVEDSEWPFKDLTPPLQQAVRLAVADGDLAAACDGLAARFDGDRAAAAAVLGVSLAVLADFFPDRCGRAVPRWQERELLAAIERHPEAEDWSPAAALLLYRKEDECRPADDSLPATLAGLGTAGSARALEVAQVLDDNDLFFTELLEIALEDPELHGRVALLLGGMQDSGLARAVAYEAAHAAVATLPPEAVERLDVRRISALLDAGLGDRALAVWDALPAERQRRLLAEPWGRDELNYSLDRRLDLAAAALLTGRREDAATWFAAMPAGSGEADRFSSDFDARPTLAYALTGEAGEAGGDAFDLMVSIFVGSSRELWRHDTLLRLLHRIATTERYDALAERFARSIAATVVAAERDGALFPPQMTEAHALWRSTLDELTAALPGHAAARLADRTDAEPGAEEVSRRPRFTARPLTFLDEILPARRPVSRFEVDLPPGFHPVRSERRGSEVVVLALSQALDPVGELGSGGYWVLRSRDGGGRWQELYTGLRLHAPYEAVPTSRLPLFDLGGVRVEVRWAELDESSISLPPIGLRIDRRDEPLYLDLPWSVLERDADGDGLTDLVEERLLTDPRSADSDGDGLGDGEDPLPGVAYRRDDSAHTEAFAAFFAAISGSEARAILPNCPDGSDALCFGRPGFGGGHTRFVVGDPASWTGLAPAIRTVVMSWEEHRQAEARFGPIFATEVLLFQLDHAGERALFIWSQQWTGGSGQMFRGPGGEWRVVLGAQWIT